MKDSAHRQSAQNGDKAPRTHQADSGTDLIPNTDLITPQSIHYLQRTIGNQATLKLIQRRGVAVQGRVNRPLVQREDSAGLRDTSMSAPFVDAVHAYVNNPAHGEQHPSTLLIFFTGLINDQLATLKVSPILIDEKDLGDKGAEFAIRQWRINFNSKSGFGTRTRIADFSEADISAMVGNLYHEARHAEQNFRVAQLMAGRALQEGNKQSAPGNIQESIDTDSNPKRGDVKTVVEISEDIAIRMGMPPMIAWEATMQPIEPDSGQASEEAQGWFDSMLGDNRAYRDMILTTLNTAIVKLLVPFNQLVEAINNQAQATQIDAKISEINGLLPALYAVRDGELQAEHDRLSAITSPSTIEGTMLTHCNTLTALIDKLRNTTLDVNNAQAMQTDALALAEARHKAYEQLPEEADAHATGEMAQKQFNQKP